MKTARTITILFSSVILFLMFGCTQTEQPIVNDSVNGTYENDVAGKNNADNICEDSEVTIRPLQTRELPINEDGFIEIIMPENLLGGRTAERTAESFLDTVETLAEMGIQPPASAMIANADGTLTMLYTLEQLIQGKQNIRTFARIHERTDVVSIRDVIFVDEEMLTEIIVVVNASMFAQSLFDRTMSNIVLVMYAGNYQILHGVAPDEWRTTITVKDVDTGEIISRTEFPHDDMYTIEN